MPRLNLEFVSQPKNRLLTIIMLVAGLITVGASLIARHELLTEINEDESQLTKLNHQLNSQRFVPTLSQDNPKALKEVEQISTILTLPWIDIVESLQLLTPKTIQLVKIQPDLQTRYVSIQGYAKDYQEFLNYLTLLEKQEHWHNVQPVSQENTLTIPDKSLIFQLTAQWSSL